MPGPESRVAGPCFAPGRATAACDIARPDCFASPAMTAKIGAVDRELGEGVPGNMRSACILRFVTHLLCGLVLAFPCGAPAVAEELGLDLVVSLSLGVDPLKSNGSPWDGYPAVGGRIIVPDPSNAPDIAVCLVSAAGAPDCIWRAERRRRISHCPDSVKCTIDGIRLPRLPIGLIILDVDLVRHDLIDFVVLTGDRTEAGELAKVEANLRSAMAKLTPGETPSERERRQRKARVLPLDLCMGEKAKCDLSQSQFWLQRR